MEESDVPQSPGPRIPKRKHKPGLRRVQIACERCRARKNKCDGKSPKCSICEKAGTPCVVVDRMTYRQYPRGHVEDLENEVERLKARVAQLESEASRYRTGASAHLDPSATTSNAHLRNPAQTPGTPDTNIGITSLDAPTEDRFVGESSGNYFGNILQTVLLHSDYKVQQGPAHSRLKLRLARDSPSSGDSPRSGISLPAPAEAERLRDAFFTHQWPSLPFLHKPSFLLKHYHPVMNDTQAASPISLFLTFMVFALGAIDVSRLGQKRGSLHLEYFNIAITHYLDGLIKADNTQTVQGLLLVGYFAIMESHSVNAWHVAGQAVRVAVDIGLHRSPAPDVYSLVDTEMRKRIFWSAYAIDRNVSINLGRPSAIRDADITAELPLQLTDDELLLYPSSSAVPRSQPARHDDTSTLIHVIKARKLQSRIQDIFYLADASLAAITDLEYHRDAIRAELDDWIANVPRFAHPVAVTYQSTEWFQIVYSHSLILLYRPSPASPTTTLPALQICADASISLINSYSSLYAKNKITYTWLALHGLFMASVTMLYTIWVSPQIRRSTTKAVVKTNVTSCLALFQVMRDFWPLAARCHEVIDRLGRASVALFDKPDEQDPIPADTDLVNEQHFGEINAEYMDWFGTREAAQAHSMTETHAGSPPIFDDPYNNFSAASQNYMPDIGSNLGLFPDLDQLFQQGFDMNIPLMTSAFDQPFVSDSRNL